MQYLHLSMATKHITTSMQHLATSDGSSLVTTSPHDQHSECVCLKILWYYRYFRLSLRSTIGLIPSPARQYEWTGPGFKVEHCHQACPTAMAICRIFISVRHSKLWKTRSHWFRKFRGKERKSIERNRNFSILFNNLFPISLNDSLGEICMVFNS